MGFHLGDPTETRETKATDPKEAGVVKTGGVVSEICGLCDVQSFDLFESDVQAFT